MNLLRRTKPLLSFISHTTPTPFAKISPHALTPLSRHLLPAKSLAAPSPRLYFTDRRQIQHFPRRGPKHWYRNPRHVIVLLVLGGGVVLTVYFGNCETVPYTKRSHLVLLSPSMERQLGESQFDQLKESLKGKILPAIHPDSVRVRLISKEIIEALQRGLRQHDQGWSDLSYAAPVPDGAGDAMYSMKSRSEDEGGQIEGRWSKEDEVLDDRWVHQSRQAAESRGSQLATQHLEGLNWEVLVVKQSEANAMCLPGGKIVVFTGLLDHFRSDAEIATVIGHEVGHCIARHSAETITKNLWLTVLQIIILQFFYMPDLISTVSALLLKLPFSRRMEMEADYIGLLLLASAGYDPRVAPKVYEKLGQITGDSALQDYLSTHPSSKKRSQLLSQAEVMDEALAIYREVIAGRGVEGFL